MGDGAKAHAADTEVACPIKEETVLADKTELEDSREKFNQSETQTNRLYDEYSTTLKNIKEKYSKYVDSLYGDYGKKNQILTDFGVEPVKTGGKKGPRAKKA